MRSARTQAVRSTQPSTPHFSLSKQAHKFSVASPGRRFISYLVDLVIIGCIATLVLAPFQISPVLFIGSFLYFQGVEELSLIPLHDIAVTSISFIILAIIYFFAEAFLNLSVGKLLMGQQVVILKGFSTPRRRFFGSLQRAIVKAVPPVSMIDGLFILKRRGFNQRMTDAHNGLVVMQKKKPSWGDFLLASTILYYLPLVTMTFRSYLFSTYSSYPTNTSNDITASFENALYQIVTNNMSLGLQLFLGGVTMSFISILIIFSSSLIEGIVLGHILLSQPSLIFYNVLPHFLFETVGYVLEIGGSLIISTIILDWFEGYIKGKSVRTNMSEIGEKVKHLLIFLLISATLILIGAVVETSLVSPS